MERMRSGVHHSGLMSWEGSVGNSSGSYCFSKLRCFCRATLRKTSSDIQTQLRYDLSFGLIKYSKALLLLSFGLFVKILST